MLGTEDRGDGLIGVILSSFGLIPRPRGRKRLPGEHLHEDINVLDVCKCMRKRVSWMRSLTAFSLGLISLSLPPRMNPMN